MTNGHIFLIVNATGCPEGYATDEVAAHGLEPGRCDTSLPLYITIGVIIVFTKLLIAWQHTWSWMERERRKTKKSVHKKRLPLVPALSWYMFLCYVPFFTLTPLNIANHSNGVAIALFGMGWLGIGLQCMFYLFKFVSLGRKIAGRGGNVVVRSPARDRVGVNVDGGAETDSTVNFDSFGKLGVVLCFAALAGQSICFIIVPLAQPTSESAYKIGFGFQAIFLSLHFIAFVHHIQRVKVAVRTSYMANKTVASNSKELRLVLRKLLEQQVSLTIVEAICLILILIVASGYVPLHWYILIIFMSVESINFLLIAMSNTMGFRGKCRRMHPSSTTSGPMKSSRKKGIHGEDNGEEDQMPGNRNASTWGGDADHVTSTRDQRHRQSVTVKQQPLVAAAYNQE